MRVSALIVIACLVLTGCVTVEWKSYQNSSGIIAFQMPQDPEETRQVVNTDAGPIEVIMQTSQKDGIFYVTNVVTYSAEAIQGKDTKTILDGARDGAVSNIQGRLLSELLIEKDGVPGRELRIESSDKSTTVVARVYFGNNRLYQALAATPKEKAFSSDISKFLDSFTIKTPITEPLSST